MLAALVLVASLVLKAHDLDGGMKIVGVSIVVLTLTILGMANLLVGSKDWPAGVVLPQPRFSLVYLFSCPSEVSQREL